MSAPVSQTTRPRIGNTCPVCGGARSLSAPGLVLCKSEPNCMEALLEEMKRDA